LTRACLWERARLVVGPEGSNRSRHAITAHVPFLFVAACTRQMPGSSRSDATSDAHIIERRTRPPPDRQQCARSGSMVLIAFVTAAASRGATSRHPIGQSTNCATQWAAD
jgi:hypothetical protein